MLEKAENSIHSNHTRGVEFLSIFQKSASWTILGLFCRARAFQILFREQAAYLFCHVLVSFSVSSAEPELVMDVAPMICLPPADVDVVCVPPEKKERAPSHIRTNEDAGVFLSLMQGDETTIGYFNRMKLKRCR